MAAFILVPFVQPLPTKPRLFRNLEFDQESILFSRGLSFELYPNSKNYVFKVDAV